MTRRTFFVVCLATFTIVCQAAPLNGGTSQKASSTSAGPKAHSPSGTKSFNPRSTPRPSPTSSKIRPLSSAVSSKIPSTPFPSTVTAPSETKSTLLSSATQQYTTSAPILPTPTLPAAPNWVMYANGTTGYALSLLLSSIGADAGQRWVTAEIASTQIGSTDPAGSNKDLSSAVDTLVGEPSTHQTWVDTYIDFLIEAGGDINSTAETQVKNHGNNVTATWAVEQTKLVKAYAAAHPGNVTYVGVNVTGVQTLDAITSGEIIGWAWHGGDTNCTSSTAANSTSISMNNATSTSGGAANCTLDSDGPYTTKDYQAYSNATAAYETLQTEIAGFGDLTQMSLRAYSFKNIWPELGIFNLSMDIGGSGTYTQFAPAWTAMVAGFATQAAFGVEILESNLKNGPGDSTVNGTDILDLTKRNGTEQSTSGLSALQFIAHRINSTIKSDSPPAPAPVAAVAAGMSNDDPLNQPLANDQSLVLLAVQEGTWADKRDEYIHTARQNAPDIADKYFGPGSSGSGPIGRHWTHLVLRTSFELVNGGTQVGLVELFGKVYDVLPLLT